MKELKVTPPEGYVIDEQKSTIYNIVFKKKNELPTTWEEAYTKYLCNTTIYYINTNGKITQYTEPIPANAVFNKNALLSSERAEEVLALIQLITLKDIYNNGWKPDYTNFQEEKHTIVNEDNDIVIKVYNSYPRILAFKTSGLAYKFIENFKDLINIAKELI